MTATDTAFARTAALLLATGLLSACTPSPAPPATSVAVPTPPMAQHTPAPDYPPELACRQVGGQVVLDVRLAANGMPIGVDVFRSSGVKALDDSAVAAVREWQFKGATAAGGKPTPSKLQVPVTFKPPNPPPDECNRYL